MTFNSWFKRLLERPSFKVGYTLINTGCFAFYIMKYWGLLVWGMWWTTSFIVLSIHYFRQKSLE